MRDGRIQFDMRTPFHLELRRRVDEYFERTGQPRRDVPRMYRKTAVLMGAWLGVWLVFMLATPSWALTIPLGVACGLAIGGLGMSVMHDGGHRAYSSRRWVNLASSWVLDLMGSSSYIWNVKHNVMHHTYPNVVGSDDDIDIGSLARLAPASPRLGFHRWQQLYMWPLYGFISVKWHLVDDFRQLAQARVGAHSFPRPKGAERFVFWAGKAVFFTWALVLPLLFKPAAFALAFYFIAQCVQGLVLATVFQLAHCVEEAAYLEPPEDGDPLRLDFARHQLATSVEFAPDNRLLTWYVGGLNFQAVHHLFPRICHVHYPALAKIVAEVCAEHDQAYLSTPTVGAALRSHYRWLRTLGAPQAA